MMRTEIWAGVGFVCTFSLVMIAIIATIGVM
jgi:hypothetical protein